jgi:hypothetical protein
MKGSGKRAIKANQSSSSAEALSAFAAGKIDGIMKAHTIVPARCCRLQKPAQTKRSGRDFPSRVELWLAWHHQRRKGLGRAWSRLLASPPHDLVSLFRTMMYDNDERFASGYAGKIFVL